MQSLHVVVQYILGSRILPFTIASGDVSTTQPLNEARILGIDRVQFSIEPAKKFHPEMDILASKTLEIFHALKSTSMPLLSSAQVDLGRLVLSTASFKK
jgi:hypothetical protein